MKTLLFNIVCAIAFATCSYGTVTFVGNDWDTDAGWRSPGSIKANDIDGDNIYGTAGYYLASGLRAGYKGTFLTDNIITGASNPDDIDTLPPYIRSLEYSDPAERGRSWGGSGGNFGTLDNVGGGHTGLTGAAILLNAASAVPMSLTLKRQNSPDFRLTLILGNNPDEPPTFNDPRGQRITVNDGSGAVTQPASGDTVFHSRTTYQSWDISAGSSDITIVLEGLPLSTGLARLSGIAVDVEQVVPPSIQRQPEGGAFLLGLPVTLSVVASGSAPLEYSWWKDSEVIPDAVSSTLTFPSIAFSDAGGYQVVVSNAGGSVTSSPAFLQVEDSLPAKLANYQAVVQNELSIFAYYAFDDLTANDLTTFYNGSLAGSAGFGTGVGGGADKALALRGTGWVNIGSNDVFHFSDGTGTIEAWVRADWTANPGYNPCLVSDRGNTAAITRYSLHMRNDKASIAFWNGTTVSDIPIPFPGTDWHHMAVVFDNTSGTQEWTLYWDGQPMGTASNDFGTVEGVAAQIGSADAAGLERWIGALDEVVYYLDPLDAQSIAEHVGAFIAGDPPVIVNQPQGGAFLAGSDVTLMVRATGPDLVYQWYHDGELLTGATEAALLLASVAADDAGAYTVTVSNETDVVTSEPAQLVVLVPDLACYQATVRAEPGLISYYSFDSGTAEDVVSAHNGELVGATDFGAGVGNGADQALLLGGGHVNLGQVEDFHFTNGAGTIEAWVRADWTANPGHNPCIFSDREGGPTRWSIHLLAAKDQLAFWNGSAVSLFSIPNAAAVWHHLAVIFNAGTWTVAWDGRVLGTQALALGADVTSGTHLGSTTTAGGEQWLGGLDEVAVYSVALRPRALQDHYRALIVPCLNFELAGDQMLISWTRQGYLLRENPDLSNPAGWTTVTGGDVSPVTITIQPGGKNFYRLQPVP